MASNMASKGASPSGIHRAEIDTTAPFESVKEAVSLFGEKVLGRQVFAHTIKRSPGGEKWGSKNRELHLIQKELSKAQEQLKNAESTKSRALREVEKAKKVVESLTVQLEKAKQSTVHATEASEAARKRAEELQAVDEKAVEGGNTVWKAEVDEARKQHSLALAELNSTKQELRKLKQEHASALEAQALAVKQAENSASKEEANLRKIEELSKEISEINDSLIFVKIASSEAEKERAAIVAEKEDEAAKDAKAIQELHKQIEALKEELNASRDLESKWIAMKAEVEYLEKEVQGAKASHADIGKAQLDANEKLCALKTEIEVAKNTLPDLERSRETNALEIDEVKSNLLKAIEEGSSLKQQLEMLSTELDQVRKELAGLRRKEAEAEAAVATLNAELHKVRSNLAGALAAEAKAKGEASSLSLSLQQMTSEAEAAKREKDMLEAEVEKAKLEAEERKVEIETAERRLQDALKEAEVAKAAEAVAIAKIKDLSDKTTAARASTSEHSAEITISEGEYKSLNRKVDESKELADMKVGVAMAHIEAVEAGGQEAQLRFDKVNKEIEDMKSSEEEALKAAERADAAKRAVESELRRWREQEERKRAASVASIPDAANNGDNDSNNPSQKNTVHTESLAEVLNLQIPSPELLKDEHSLEGYAHLRKKKPHIPKIGRIFSKSKGRPSDNNLVSHH
eukprot:TRINITY_DN11921_c0_g2_i1.p1 TRINITY_DN11921_c0_g2~~TRINITY_DN11921_c0_g2_i1.p1  ORF type:complete len:689 (-),score=269.83 TRINITY_DN11921_c0_g2_i1:467-2533(-)